MKAPGTFALVFFSFPFFSLQRKYSLLQDNLELEYVDKTRINIISAGLVKLNDTIKVLNVTVVLKIDLPEDFKVSSRGYKSVHDEYRVALFRHDGPMKSSLQEEYFDLQALYLDYTKPPLIWPLQKNVAYHTMGWIPNYNKWLPNFPAGKWKFQMTFGFANNTNVSVMNWFFRIQY